MTAIDRIETLLDERRSFPPPEGFRKQAHVSDPKVYEQAKKDREGYWADWARQLDWIKPWDKVLEWKPPHAKWFLGGKLNASANCLDRHVKAGRGNKVALIWEGEDGRTARLTYGELAEETGRCANALRALGLKKGDRVGLYLPMIPEVVVAQLAIGKLGAVYTPIFSGFGPDAVAARLQDCEARLLITCDGIERRGKLVATKEVADRAVVLSPSVERVLVVNRLRRADAPWDPRRDVWWHELIAGQPAPADTERTAPEDPYMIIYTSGTTGRPKGVVHVQGGFPIKGLQDMAHCFDVKPSDTVFWFTDMGWMMGPWVIGGSLMLGATVFLYDGTPDFPDPGRIWEMVERHRLTVLGIAPTAIRALMRAGDDWVTLRDLSSLRVLGSSGEPWNPDAWRWFQGVVGGGRCPVVNYSGGTEVSGGIVASTVITPQKPTSFAGPVPGMDADVVDEGGSPVRGQVGELVVRQPWPGMARGFWRERERYLEAYWSRLPGTWVHGDWALIDADGFWYIHGRSDDTIKIAGKRLGPAEVESAAVTHPAVAEAAAIGVPHEIKGQALVVFCTLKPGHRESDSLRRAVADAVVAGLGKSLKPERVLFVGEVPKTRSGKVMRRLIRAVHLGKEPGDLSALENAAALDAIRAAR